MITKLLALVIVTMLPNGSTINILGQQQYCGQYLNGYINNVNKIFVCNNTFNLSKEDTLKHEFGHYVYFQILNDRQRNAWNKLYGQGYEEGFAEDFKDYSKKYFMCFSFEKNCLQKYSFLERVENKIHNLNFL